MPQSLDTLSARRGTARRKGPHVQTSTGRPDAAPAAQGRPHAPKGHPCVVSALEDASPADARCVPACQERPGTELGEGGQTARHHHVCPNYFW